MLSSKNLREPEILDVRPVTHLEELAVQPRVCLQVGWGGPCLQVGWGGVGRQALGHACRRGAVRTSERACMQVRVRDRPRLAHLRLG